VPLVGEARRREAVDKVTAMQFDRHGNRIWRQAAALLDAEHARYAIGEVAVPYGTCTEPSNVQAGGGACPVRFRCAGCGHFRADVSHLPDLTAYLDDLLRTRERFAAAIDGVDEWARADATPAEEEITRIRRLITQIKGDIAQPTPGSSSGQRVRSRRSYRSSGSHWGMSMRNERMPSPVKVLTPGQAIGPAKSLDLDSGLLTTDKAWYVHLRRTTEHPYLRAAAV
jgi:hypothetical protein